DAGANVGVRRCGRRRGRNCRCRRGANGIERHRNGHNFSRIGDLQTLDHFSCLVSLIRNANAINTRYQQSLVKAPAVISAQTNRDASLLIYDLDERAFEHDTRLTVADCSLERTRYRVLSMSGKRSADRSEEHTSELQS